MSHYCWKVFFFVLLMPLQAFAQVQPDVATTPEDTPTSFSVVNNDSHLDGIDASSVDLDVTSPGKQTFINSPNGSFSVDNTGSVTFTPAPNFFGEVSRDYGVDTNLGASAGTASITVTVTSVNDAPVAVNDEATTTRNVAATLEPAANDTDIDGSVDPLTIDLNTLLPGIQTSNATAAGTWQVTGGVVTFTPVLNFTGDASLSYTVQDNEGGTSNAATITVTVTSVNSAPVANNDAISTNEDVPVSVNVLTNDTDDAGLNTNTVDLDPGLAGIQNTKSTAQGNFSVNAAGVLTFTPALNYNGMASVTYTVEDTDGVTSNVATVEVTVNSVNDAPVAVADAATTPEDTPVTVNVVGNDTDVDGTIDASSVDLNISVAGIQNTRSTSNGEYSVNSSGVVTFTPALNFQGLATIQYTVNDNEGLTSAPTTLSITVTAVNDNPVANNDAASTNENQAVTLNVVANDTDDGSINAATVDLNTGTAGIQNTFAHANGNFSVNSSGVVTFSPATNFSGIVSITYTVNDNEGATSNQATITITVNAVNDKPVANGDAITTPEDTPVTFNVLTNDTDDTSLNTASVDLNISVPGIQNTRSIAQGTFSVDGSGNVTFTPAANYFGTASINYTVSDNEGATSDPAQIVVTITSVNDKPIAVNDPRTINEDNSVAINVVANDTDVDGTIDASTVDLDPSQAGIQTSRSTAEGTFTKDMAGVVTFVPVNNFFGSASITYTVNDNDGATSDPASITITVNSVNDPPIANNDIANTAQGQAVSFNVITNDIDVDGSINSATVDLDTSTPGIQKIRVVASGTYEVNDAGLVTFTPLPTFSGTSTINYTVQDNVGSTSNLASISVLVNFVNTAPVANDDAAATNEDTPIVFNILTNDTDDGTIRTNTVDLNPPVSGIQSSISTASGSFTVDGSGNVTYTPALNFNGTATITYTVEDNIGATSNVANISVTVSPINDAPVASNDAASTSEDVPVNINILSNDTDVDGTLDPASVDLIVATDAIDKTNTTPQGTFTANEAGVVTFTPAANFNGSTSISYNVRDNLGAKSNNATITVTVSNVNDPPTFDVIANQRVLRNAAARTITITGISPGPGETESLLLSATSSNTAVVPTPVISYAGTGATATLTFKPQLNQSGVVDITVKAVDSGLNEFTRTFQINVVNVEIISTPVNTAIEGELYQYQIQITEVEETLTLVALQKPTWAVLTSTGKNTATLSGTPPVNSTASTVVIELRDGASVIDEQTFVLNINRRPSATSFGLELNEDVALLLPVERFLQSYSDPDNHPLAEVQITALPRHGTLLLGTSSVVVDQIIPSAELSTLVYQPALNYNGLDTLYFRVGDTFSFSQPPSYIHFVIAPVNDPPAITFLETEPLVFDIGRELAQIFTPNFNAEDAEGDNIVSAEIGFRRPNFNTNNDVLEFSNTSNIKGVYDPNAGILSLTGSASVAEYVEAIRSIRYNYINLTKIILDPRTVYITLSDGTSTSEVKEKNIQLIFDFVELKIPNVFSPDGNGKNDVWPFRDDRGLEPYSDAIIRVFDQRGKLQFETTGFATPWDGKSNGVEVPNSTYFYVIDLKYGKIQYKGSVTILRAGK